MGTSPLELRVGSQRLTCHLPDRPKSPWAGEVPGQVRATLVGPRGQGLSPWRLPPGVPTLGHQPPRPSLLLPRGLGSRMRLLWSRISNLTAGPLGRRFRSRPGPAQLSPQVFGDPNRDRAWPGLCSSVLLPAQLGRTVSPPGPIPGGRQSRTGPTITHRNRPNRVATAAEAAAASRGPSDTEAEVRTAAPLIDSARQPIAPAGV